MYFKRLKVCEYFWFLRFRDTFSICNFVYFQSIAEEFATKNQYLKYSFPVTKVWYFSLKVLHFSCLYFIQGAFVLLTLVRFQTVNSVTHKTIFPGRIKWWKYSPKWRHGHSFQYHYWHFISYSYYFISNPGLMCHYITELRALPKTRPLFLFEY